MGAISCTGFNMRDGVSAAAAALPPRLALRRHNLRRLGEQILSEGARDGDVGQQLGRKLALEQHQRLSICPPALPWPLLRSIGLLPAPLASLERASHNRAARTRAAGASRLTS